jgi:hypothetical protein
MPRTLIRQYQADLFFPNHDMIEAYLEDKNFLYRVESHVKIKKINFVDDSENKVRFLKGDFERTRDHAGGTITIFVYNDGKVAGFIKYTVDLKLPDNKINGKYVEEDNANILIQGYVTTDGTEGKVGFIAMIYT